MCLTAWYIPSSLSSRGSMCPAHVPSTAISDQLARSHVSLGEQARLTPAWAALREVSRGSSTLSLSGGQGGHAASCTHLLELGGVRRQRVRPDQHPTVAVRLGVQHQAFRRRRGLHRRLHRTKLLRIKLHPPGRRSPCACVLRRRDTSACRAHGKRTVSWARARAGPRDDEGVLTLATSAAAWMWAHVGRLRLAREEVGSVPGCALLIPLVLIPRAWLVVTDNLGRAPVTPAPASNRRPRCCLASSVGARTVSCARVDVDSARMASSMRRSPVSLHAPGCSSSDERVRRGERGGRGGVEGCGSG